MQSCLRINIRGALRARRAAGALCQPASPRHAFLTASAPSVFDYIIVGGGSAGSILANRLSARGTNRVLLCEAGEDTPDGRVPEAILDSRSGFASRDPRFLWHQLRVTTEVIPHNDPTAPRPRALRYEQGRVLGGGSSINGQLANRGSPADYDDWEARGATGWR